MLRTVAGVHAAELRPAARSAVVRYDPALIDEQTLLAELAAYGIEIVAEEVRSEPTPPLTTAGKTGPLPPPPSPASGRGGAKADEQENNAREQKDGERSALMEALIGPPPKLDRRFAEGLALSAVSLLAARRVGLALGGGTTLPAYFAIWFALRRMTGAGRRR